MVISIGMSIIIIQKLPATSTEFLNFVLRHKRQFNTPRFLEQAINIFLSCFSMYSIVQKNPKAALFQKPSLMYIFCFLIFKTSYYA
jgi:hypothetical protein